MIIALLFLLQLSFPSLNAVPTINDAADCSVNLVSELFKQQLNQAQTCRLLRINNKYYDALVTIFLARIASQYFGANYKICFNDNGHFLEVRSDSEKDVSTITVPELGGLEEQYLSILDVIRGAWQTSSKGLHKNLLSVDRDENEWQLYVKPNFLLDQHSLINALAQKYISAIKGIKHYQVSAHVMNCSVSTDEKNLHLWIKKDCDKDVQSFFKFRIND
jgi:hypothetical protein